MLTASFYHFHRTRRCHWIISKTKEKCERGGDGGGMLTSEALLLVTSLLFAVELVEGTWAAIGEDGRELLRLQLLLDTMELTATRRHWTATTKMKWLIIAAVTQSKRSHIHGLTNT